MNGSVYVMGGRGMDGCGCVGEGCMAVGLCACRIRIMIIILT